MFQLEPLWTGQLHTQQIMTSTYALIVAFRLIMFKYQLASMQAKEHRLPHYISCYSNGDDSTIQLSSSYNVSFFPRGQVSPVTIMCSMMTITSQLIACKMSPFNCVICFQDVIAVCPTLHLHTVHTQLHSGPATCLKIGKTIWGQQS